MTTTVFPTAADRAAAQTQLDQLDGGALPAQLSEVLQQVLAQLAAGKAVQVVALDPEIGTQQAAELLGVSRPYLVKLVEEGALPHRKIGPRRRLYLEDVLAYRARLEGQRARALQALADDLQDLGLD